jgi:hypothetical protein
LANGYPDQVNLDSLKSWDGNVEYFDVYEAVLQVLGGVDAFVTDNLESI